MTIKSFAVIASVLAVAACGDTTQNPANLKGANFVAKSGDANITLNFDAEEMRINGQAVNLYNATYTAEGNTIKFGDMASTMMAGPDADMTAEQEYFQFMSTVETYSLKGSKLTLKNGEGKEMVFEKVVTEEEVAAPAEETAETPAEEPVAETPAEENAENADAAATQE